MTYLELAYEAAHEYDRGLIALEEYNEKIKPLCVEINQKDNWIPVSERLPEEGKDVLITILLRRCKCYCLDAAAGAVPYRK